MIIHTSPSINTEGIPFTEILQAAKKILMIMSMAEYLYSIYSPTHYMM